MKQYLFSILLITTVLMIAKPPVLNKKRMPSKPFITGDGFRSMSDHVFDETDYELKADEIQLGDIVFVKSDKMVPFFETVHPGIKNPYILITHNSDASTPGKCEHHLDDDRIIHWFGQNPSLMHHKKFTPVPIGIMNRYAGRKALANCLPLSEKPYDEIKKDYLLGYNFRVGLHAPDRFALFDYFEEQPFAHNLLTKFHKDYVATMSLAKFVVSPRGGGLDCHRTWEAFIVGAIPILLASELDELLEGMPAVIVADWKEINEHFLEQHYVKIKELFIKNRIPEKTTFDYWHAKILTLQQSVRSSIGS